MCSMTSWRSQCQSRSWRASVRCRRGADWSRVNGFDAVGGFDARVDDAVDNRENAVDAPVGAAHSVRRSVSKFSFEGPAV